ncbi:M48 family metallopeptidase [Pseudodesulfovibrio sediminis]|uniref:Peptidase M48 n=1 Tax=Pseudodesulfovibrio sediminis TaxID=2810563 RepID=A0ABN6EUU2_9BACT|nr:M48 family metallopeptidase [Pseudodesulfovibrio sediminis]BCS90053.1 peptidase M48 [Pseudodesulfovibrio sediminis]
MNIYLAVIIASLLLSWLLGILSDHLSAKAMKPTPPKEFQDVFDAAKYAQSQEYTRASMHFSTLTGTFNIVVIIAVILSGGFNWLDMLIRSLAFGPMATGLLYIGALGLISGVMSLPFEAYQTFVLENRFGFNTTTPGTFFLDRFKGMILTALIGGILVAGVLLFFRETGPFAWLWCWGLAVTVSLALTYVAPTWILPLFNTFSPLEEGELRTALERYADKNGFELSGIFVMDGSKRSTKGNAFFTGLGNRKRIALFDTLIKEQTTEEIVAVLAHEVGHAKLGHIRKRLITGFLKTGAVFYLMSLFLDSPGLFAAFGMEHISNYAGLTFFVLLYTPLSLALSVLSNMVSRKHEFEADAFAAHTTCDPMSMISALKKLSASNLSNLTPHPLTVCLEYSHPPVLARVRRLAAI